MSLHGFPWVPYEFTWELREKLMWYKGELRFVPLLFLFFLFPTSSFILNLFEYFWILEMKLLDITISLVKRYEFWLDYENSSISNIFEFLRWVFWRWLVSGDEFSGDEFFWRWVVSGEEFFGDEFSSEMSFLEVSFSEMNCLDMNFTVFNLIILTYFNIGFLFIIMRSKIGPYFLVLHIFAKAKETQEGQIFVWWGIQIFAPPGRRCEFLYKLQSYQIELHFRFLDSGGANIWTKSMVTINVLNVQIFAPSARRGEYLDKEHVYVNHALCPRIHPYGK